MVEVVAAEEVAVVLVEAAEAATAPADLEVVARSVAVVPSSPLAALEVLLREVARLSVEALVVSNSGLNQLPLLSSATQAESLCQTPMSQRRRIPL